MSDDPTQDLPNNEALKHLVSLVQGMGAQLSSLQVKVDERLYDTRPLWESVQGQINELRFDMKQGFREFRAEVVQSFQELRGESKAEMDKLRTELTRELRHVSNSLDALHGKTLRYDTIQRDIENRVRDTESKEL
ncbi:MAG: hypothetical protein WAU45_20135 [Blastocatellia bacterium]